MTTWFITGISRGLGRALAEAVLAEGDTVVGTVRTEPQVSFEGSGSLHLLKADFANVGEAEAAIDRAFDRVGRIDVIVNNAGYGLLGAVEMASDEEVSRLFEVDVFSPFRIIRAALPRLRAQGSGHIVNVTSVAGRAPGPGAAIYSAAKHALEGLSASLAQEVAPLGIKVTAVAPGAFRTDFLSEHSIRKSRAEDAAYAASVGRSSAAFDAMAGGQLGDPVRGAQAIVAAVRSENPPLHLLLGSDAWRRTRAKLDAIMDEMDRWEETTLGTDFRQSS